MKRKNDFLRNLKRNLSNLKYTSHFIPSLNNSHILHLYQIQLDSSPSPSSSFVNNSPSCFLLHGGVENGKIFYSSSGKGLGPYLAKLGYNVFIGDLRGKGLSTPSIKDEKDSNYGVKEVTEVTIPTFINYINKLTNNQKLCWISHSIGGVLMASTLARHPKFVNNISCQIHFGTKRTITNDSGLNWFILNIFYGIICRMLVSYYGYLPAKKFKLGSDDDTALAYQTGYYWIHPKTNKWIDTEDNYHYMNEYNEKILQKNVNNNNNNDHNDHKLSNEYNENKSIIPPSLIFTSPHDVLARPEDVKNWCNEVGIPLSSIVELCMNKYPTKYSIKYDHFTMLTSPQAEKEHFQLVKEFLEKYHDK